ncbi:MAG: hypothetical protein ACJAR7_000739 [Polaromonas sp.]|jgi:hypothetical protein
MTQTTGTHLAVDERVVNQVKHAIANTGQHRKASQHPITGAHGVAQGRQTDK